ncbi:MAG: NADH:flavin oxidoreductase [Myxococcota bacterium]
MSTTDKRLLRVLPVERWPSREEAAAMRWFSPIALGSTETLRRTWVPAMVPWRATEDGLVTDAVVEWYRRFAEGKPGVLVVEATGVRDVPSGPLLRIGHDRFLPGLERLVRAVHDASGGETRLFIQLIDFLQIRRRPPREKFLLRFLPVDEALRGRAVGVLGNVAKGDEAALRQTLTCLDDDVLEPILGPRQWESLTRGYRERVTDTELGHIRELPQTLPPVFAAAALRARRAGFDGVELHYAHAYTMASFLSRRNTRTDGYGSELENRLRLPLEVCHAVRQAVGTYPVGVRFLGDEVIDDGSNLEDAVHFGVAFARAGFDYLSISKGGKFEDAKEPKVGQAVYPYTGPSGHECMPTVRIDRERGGGGPFGRNVPLAKTIRQSVREAGFATPVVAAGGICSPWQAEAILENEEADLVAAARQSLCDPDWFRKIELGRGEEVRRCFFTNYCEALDQAHKEVTCQRWDREDDGTSPAMAKDQRRRLTPPSWSPGAST